MRVLKFGGTSLGTPANIQSMMKIVETAKRKHGEVVLIVSAFSGVTDALLEMGRMAESREEKYKEALDSLEKRHLDAARHLLEEGELRTCILNNIADTVSELSSVLQGIYLLRELSLKTMDFLMSFGETLSAYIISEAFKGIEVEAEFLDTRNLFKTNENFGCAGVYFERTYQNIQEYFSNRIPLQVATGFISSTFNNETTTLGRGGSDFTASIFGAGLEASAIEIWTDVDGVMTADPRKVKNASAIVEMSYEEAMEMSHFGAKVLHPPTMHPAIEKNILIIIKNSFRPDALGTSISYKTERKDHSIRGISSIDKISLLRIQGAGMVGIAGICMRLFGALARKGISIILITQASSEHSICLAVSPYQAGDAKREIEEEFSLEIYANQIDEVIVEHNLAAIAVVGENMRHSPGISGKVFSALGRSAVNVIAIAQGSSELNISFAVRQSEEIKALNVIHDAFFRPDCKVIHLFILGKGLIASTLFSQLCKQKEYLKRKQGIEIKVVGFADSKKMVFDEDGIDGISWRERLQYSSLPMKIEDFIKRMEEFGKRNTIFVDCTASEEPPLFYEKILLKGFSIVAPNKMANSGPYEMWSSLRNVSRRSKASFMYETNVGAGLPIIGTLKDLLFSGDGILKAEAVLSGTLSHIFNNLNERKTFSALLKDAMDKGFTEPDPRRDLSGLDVARKILILARECGAVLELSDVLLEKIVPEEYLQGDWNEDFFDRIQKIDEYFENKRAGAASRSKALRYIATYESGKARVDLEEIGMEHPFYFLSGSDNIVAFTTQRYKENPLLVRGPGAGAAVTSAGVFADIMKVSNEGEDVAL